MLARRRSRLSSTASTMLLLTPVTVVSDKSF
jgi:hypothetical protein